MASITLRDGTTLSDFGRPYITAEVNTSHSGSVETAKQMIDAAKSAGCDCVKFQSWSAETLYSASYYDQNKIAKRIVTKFSFGEPQLLECAEYCRSKGIAFASTPYSNAEVDFLIDKCNVPYIKVASMDLVTYPFLAYIAKRGAPILLSTGMSSIDEIRKAVQTIEAAGNKSICILHCIAIYPPELSTMHLNNILGLREQFPNYPIGFSDHSLGTEIATASVALGAATVEKHLTLDKKKIGMDNQMASEPAEMEQLVRQCHNVQSALGGRERVVLQAELDQRLKMRRSVILKHDVPAGTRITLADLDAKRPGTGIPPEKMASLVGKVAARDLRGDTLLEDADLK